MFLFIKIHHLALFSFRYHFIMLDSIVMDSFNYITYHTSLITFIRLIFLLMFSLKPPISCEEEYGPNLGQVCSLLNLVRPHQHYPVLQPVPRWPQRATNYNISRRFSSPKYLEVFDSHKVRLKGLLKVLVQSVRTNTHPSFHFNNFKLLLQILRAHPTKTKASSIF